MIVISTVRIIDSLGIQVFVVGICYFKVTFKCHVSAFVCLFIYFVQFPQPQQQILKQKKHLALHMHIPHDYINIALILLIREKYYAVLPYRLDAVTATCEVGQLCNGQINFAHFMFSRRCFQTTT